VPETKSIALLAYESLDDAMHDVAPILEHDLAAVEVMDDVLLDLARETTEFEAVVDQLPVGTNSLLLVEFYAESDDPAREKIDTLLADRLDSTTPVSGTEPAADASGSPTFARDVLLAHEAAKRAKFWKLRKSGLPILLSRTDDSKHVAFIEDTAIPPENLPAFVAEFEAILDEHDTFASYYAHAGPGVLHQTPSTQRRSMGLNRWRRSPTLLRIWSSALAARSRASTATDGRGRNGTGNYTAKTCGKRFAHSNPRLTRTGS